MPKKEIIAEKYGEVYLHISNSGIRFSVFDTPFGPCVEISLSSFGNIDTTIKTYTDKNSIKALGDMFSKCAKRRFSKEYCCKARVLSVLKISPSTVQEFSKDSQKPRRKRKAR